MMFHTGLNKEPSPPPEQPEWKYRVLAWISLFLGLAPRQTMAIGGIARDPYRLIGWGWIIRWHLKPNRPLLRVRIARWDTGYGEKRLALVVASRLLSRPYTPREAEGMSRIYSYLMDFENLEKESA